jgi:hypothetical protein
MAWRGPLGAGEEALDSGLELSLGLPAYFARPSGVRLPRLELVVHFLFPVANGYVVPCSDVW